MKHSLPFTIVMLISLMMACCLTTTLQRLTPNLAGQAQTAVVTNAQGLGEKLVETMLPSINFSTLQAQAETLMPSVDVSTLQAQAQTMVATSVQGLNLPIDTTPQAPAGTQVEGVPADFPVTPDATGLKVLATGENAQINYQSKMSMAEVLTYCTVQLTMAGWQMRPELLNTSDTTFSMVFANSAKPTDIVIQGVQTGSLVNVNVRFEAVK